MAEESPLTRIADDLGLTIVRPFAGGVYGATLVTDAAGDELVLKTMPTEMWSKAFSLGASLVNRLRASGYPAPEYIDTGAAHGATWSLQRVLPGAIPDVMSESHMQQLLALAERHAGAVPEGAGAWLAHQMPYLQMSLRTITDTPITRALALELGAVFARTKDIELLDDGVVHNDFHHRNFLAIGDDVSAVFDWEFADVGDWRYDLVTLAFWSVLMPHQIPPDVATLAVDRMHAACPPDALALFTAVRTITQLDFDARNNPQFLPGLIEGIEAHVAPWWRDS
jgi:aminoglycoside phosphotransferase (APT) family kinase protein